VYPFFESIVWKLLPQLCYGCSALVRREKTCPECSEPLRTYKRSTGDIEATLSSGEKQAITPLHILGIFSAISDETWDVLSSRLGVDSKSTHPTHWIATSLLISPPGTRPSNVTDKGYSSDDTTTLLHLLVQANHALELQLKGTSYSNMQELWEKSHEAPVIAAWTNLSLAFVSLYKNKNNVISTTQRRRNGTQCTGIEEQLNGKEGEIRRNGIGKRPSNTARAVITGSSTRIAMDEIVINQMSTKLTEKVRVYPRMKDLPKYTKYMADLKANCVQIDYFQAPGKPLLSINTAYLRNNRLGIREPMPGSYFHMPIRAGSMVAFNRQPTLGPTSMQAHRVAYVDDATFVMHLGMTTPYNADFDGDEMNTHPAASLAVRAEFEELMSVVEQLLDPASGQPVAGLVQNALAGLHIMMGKNIPRARVFQMMMQANTTHLISSVDTDTVPGRTVVSWLIPDCVCITVGDLRVVDGVVLEGTIKKGTARPLIHAIAKEVGNRAAVDFCTRAARVADEFLATYGQTFMYDELNHPGEQALLQSRQTEIFTLGITDNDFLRNELLRSSEVVADRLRAEGGSIAELVLGSGAKGGAINLGTMSGVIGLQEVYGKPSTRSLPCFGRDCKLPTAFSYVTNNYMQGLTPADIFKMSGPTRQQMSDQVCAQFAGVVVTVLTVLPTEHLHRGGGAPEAEDSGPTGGVGV
jgi:DNA-directed RNA polymerase beta' subunit